LIHRASGRLTERLVVKPDGAVARVIAAWIGWRGDRAVSWGDLLGDWERLTYTRRIDRSL